MKSTTHKDLIESIKLTKLELIVSSPSNGNFKFLKSIEIYLSAAGLPEVLIAKKEQIPDDINNYLNLDVQDVELKEYIKQDKVKLKLSTVTDQILTSDHQILVGSKFFVDAKILGL